MPVEWNKIRSWNGSQATAFEELTCQLAFYENVPSGSRFVRKGAPDAGVECVWELPSGQEYGWQAKFFTTSPSSSQWGEVDSSVQTALKKHPALRQYTVCMAIDRPDPRLESGKSFLERWKERVTKWESWAASRNMSVEFRFWGSFELLEKLSCEEHRGRLFFWFHEELFTIDWFEKRLDEVIASVGPRYTPEINVELPVSAVFESLSRSPEFLTRFREAYGGIGKAWSRNSLRSLETDAPAKLESLSQQLANLIKVAKNYDRPGIEPVDWGLMRRDASEALKCISDIDSLIYDLEQKSHESGPEGTGERAKKIREEDPFGYARYNLRRIKEKVADYSEFVNSDVAELTNIPALLLVGSAGTGKTHLFCDAAKKLVEASSPTVVLLGNQFRNEDPWAQILRILDLSCSREEFLGALESAAQLSGRRAIIFIDALNEGEGRCIWENYLPSMLVCLARFPWISVAVSVRDSYEKLTIPDGLVPNKLVRFQHYGFADQEYQAAKQYFEFYGIELPAVPILTPEFQNPLFLSCFCKGLKNRGLTKIPAGVRGISSVFDFFLDSVNDKLAKPSSLDYDPKAQLVGRATSQLAEWQSRTPADLISRSEAQKICENILPGRSYENSLFRHLLSEGVLSETISYDDASQCQDMVTFSYQRLSDHLVLRELLKKYVSPENPALAFQSGQPLGRYFEDESACFHNRGLADALAIQGPETFKKEIYELIPNAMDKDPISDAFIESLLWRDAKTISDTCLPYINKHILPRRDLAHKLLDALLTIAPNPDHPFNADFLHQNLIKKEMADRDAWWSIFLCKHYEEKTSIDRLVTWSWSEADRSHIADESIRLVGKALAWFLTTSNRSLRDQATKALVSLFVDRIHVLRQVISDFAKVNDPYVLERLYAVAYGCALKSTDPEAKASLAQLVYELVFKDGTPPCHILIRDYARGVIEVAIRDGLNLKDVNADKIRPPYKSEWPLEIPSEEDVKKYGEWSEGMPDEKWALHTIFNSVMGMGDFARYILGSDHGNLRWSKRRLGEPRTPSRKEQHDAFVASLSKRQKNAWDSYMHLRYSLDLYLRVGDPERKEIFGQLSEEKLKALLEEVEHTLNRTLRRKQKQAFSEMVLPYLNASPAEKDEFAMPVRIAQLWILKRVIDLGWTVERFGRFDRNQSLYANYGRSFHKSERIGKKYQWLAYHEFLAHMADNLEFREDYWSDKPTKYVGPWQLWLRDIDPSSLIKKTLSREFEPTVSAWWAPVQVAGWNEEMDETQWLKSTENLPPIERLPIVIEPGTGREWYVLACFYDWEEPTPPDSERFDIPRRYVWYMVKSYLLKSEQEDSFCNWAERQQFMGRWMPESPEQQTGVFLGEFFWAPAFEFDTPYYAQSGWTRGDDNRLPCEVLASADRYLQEHSSYDHSIEDTILIRLPAKWIADNMKLSWRGIDGCYFDPAGHLVAQDPAVRTPGPRALLVEKEFFSAFLAAEGYRLVWTLLGEKGIRSRWTGSGTWPGRMELSGYLREKDGRPDGVATAYWIKDQEPKKITRLRI